MRPIDAEELMWRKYKIENMGRPLSDDEMYAYHIGWNDAIDTIMVCTPTLDAEPIRHGHWIVDEDGNITCSECGHHGVGDNYCERCGAKMDISD